VRLARPVRTQHRDPVAEPELGIERIGQSVQFELLDHHGFLAGARST
jgi:hypothetical protein